MMPKNIKTIEEAQKHFEEEMQFYGEVARSAVAAIRGAGSDDLETWRELIKEKGSTLLRAIRCAERAKQAVTMLSCKSVQETLNWFNHRYVVEFSNETIYQDPLFWAEADHDRVAIRSVIQDLELINKTVEVSKDV